MANSTATVRLDNNPANAGLVKHQPASEGEVCELLATCHARRTNIFPQGGGTQQGWGAPISGPGITLDVTSLNQVLDYPTRDLTLTVQAGLRVAELQRMVRANGHDWPILLPFPERATVGGALSGASGSVRFNQGLLLRDTVIGVAAVDGTGKLFHGGGRVVKNVAGYDFCKLLTGARGTLGVLTSVTLKLNPRPACLDWLLWEIESPQAVILRLPAVLAALAQAGVPLASMQMLSSRVARLPGQTATSRATLAIGCEGTVEQVQWATQTARDILERHLRADRYVLGEVRLTADAAWNDSQRVPSGDARQQGDTEGFGQALTNWPHRVDATYLLKFQVLPSEVGTILESVEQQDPHAQWLADPLRGTLWVASTRDDPEFVTKTLIGVYQPLANRQRGAVTVAGGTQSSSLTPRARWGAPPAGAFLMQRVKQAFDPLGILNPGRFGW